MFIGILSSCTVLTRSIRYWDADIDDYKVFDTYEFKENETKCHFVKNNSNKLDSLQLNFKRKGISYKKLKPLLKTTTTRAFIIIQNDSVIFEKYFNGYKREDISTVFSVSKSVTSLLVGIAIDEGYISNVNDPVTKYIDELNSSAPRFKQLTIKNLLNMRSGIKFDESYENPISKMGQLYYGTNQLEKIKRMRFNCEPGTKYEYQSVSTALLGIVLEKATGKNFAKYFEEKVWKPLGMENRASWSFDDKKHRSAKAYCGLNISAIDLAKIGQLYLKNGKYHRKKIVSEDWVRQTLTPNIQNQCYQNQWYSYSGCGTDSLGNRYFNDSITATKVWKERYSKKYPDHVIFKVEKKNYRKKYRNNLWKDNSEYKWRLNLCTGQYYALGIMKQVLFIDPQKKIIMVRLGDYGEIEYVDLMWKISNLL